MRTQWIGKNVDLLLLSKCIENFFVGKALRIEREKVKRGYVISVVPSNTSDGRERPIAKIVGDPNDFVVEFLSPQSGLVSKMVGLASMFGLGGFALKRLKSEEMFSKLESEFWLFVEQTVAGLVDSADHLH